MIDKIGFEVLPNVYFRDIQVHTNSLTLKERQNKKFQRIKITGHLVLFDNLTNPTWSRQDSEILSLMKIKLLANTGAADSPMTTTSGNIKEVKINSAIKPYEPIPFEIVIENKANIEFVTGNVNKFMLVAHCYITAQSMLEKYSININRNINGPSSSELIYDRGEEVKTTFIFKYKDGTSMFGPYHLHDNGFMQGSFHRNNAHKKVIRKKIDRNLKTTYENRVASLQIQKLPLPLEEVDLSYIGSTVDILDKETLDRLNPSTLQNISYTENTTRFNIVLSKDIMAAMDRYGRILYNTNPELFFSLQDKIQIKQMNVLRAEINSRSARNRCNVIIDDTETELKFDKISSVTFKDDQLNETLTFRDKLGRNRYVEKNSIKSIEDKNYKLNDFTNREAKESKLMCKLKIAPIQFDKVKILEFEDNSIDETSNTKYKYSITYELQSNIHDIILGHINNLRSEINKIEGILKRIERKKHFNFNLNRFNKNFMIELHSYYDIVIFEENGLLRNSRNDSTLNLEAYWIKAPHLLSIITEYSRGKDNQLYRRVYELLSPLLSSPTKIRKAITLMNDEISYIEKKYDISNKQKTGIVIKKNNIKPKNRFTIKHESKKIIKNKKIVNNIRFIKNIKNGILKKSDLLKRGNVETNKFFNSIPLSANAKISSLDDDEKKSLSDVSENLTYFTPQIISIGSQKKDLTDNNIDKFNPDFFDKVVDAKIKNSLQLSIPKNNVTNLIALQVIDDPNVKEYLGDDTLFKSENEKSTEQFKRLKTFNNSFAKNLSINKKNKLNIELFNPDSKSFGLKRYDKKNKKQKLKNLPLSLKSILLGNDDTIVKFPIRNGLFDPLKNPETSEATKQNFTKIKKLEYLSGFQQTSGFPILNKPSWKKFDKNSVSYSKKILCRMIDYENEDFNIKAENNDLPSVNDVFILED